MITLPTSTQTRSSFASVMGVINHFYETNFRSTDWRNFALLSSFGKIEFGAELENEQIINFFKAVNLHTISFDGGSSTLTSPFQGEKDSILKSNINTVDELMVISYKASTTGVILVHTNYDIVRGGEFDNPVYQLLHFIDGNNCIAQSPLYFGESKAIGSNELAKNVSTPSDYIYIFKQH